MVATYPLRLRVTGPLINNPFATRPVKLTEANVVDDAYRAASGGIQGDGLLGNQSTGIWPAATNLNDNGNATTNTTGITDHSSTTTRATSGVVKFGTTAFNVVSSNLAANEGPSQPINGGLGSTQYTVSAWVWLISGAATVRATLSDTVAGKQGGTAVVLTSTPQKVTVTATTGVAGLTEASYIETTVQQVGTWRIGGWQVAVEAVPSPYIATDGADATRAASRAQTPWDAGLFTSTQGAVIILARVGYSDSADGAGGVPVWWSIGNDNSNRLLAYFLQGDNKYRFERRAANTATTAVTAAQTVVIGDYVLLLSAWDAASVYVGLNGAAKSSQAGTNIPALTISSMDLGAGISGATPFGSDIIWAATFSRVPTDGEFAAIYTAFGQNGKPKPSLSQLMKLTPGAHPTELWDGRTGIAQRRTVA